MGNSEIKRRIGPLTATSIVVANMIGAGIFTTSGIMAANLPNSGWVILCWLLGGFIALAGALCYAELATRMPEEGAEYVYLKKIYHPSLGFLTGWTSFVVGFSVPVAASAIGFSSYLYAGLSDQLSAISDFNMIVLHKLTAIIIILLFTWLHFQGIRVGAGVQNVLTILKVLLVLGLATLGMLMGDGDWSQISLVTNESSGRIAIGTSMILVGFAYSGWNASAYIAGELKNPKKNIALSLVLGTSIVILIYIAINLFIFYAVPFSDVKGILTIGEAASIRAFGPWMGKGISVLIGFVLLSSLSAYIIIGPRLYYAMAKDRLFFPFAAKINPRHGVPGISIVIQGVLAVFMVMVGSFEQLLVYMGFSLSVFPWLAVAGLFLARRRGIGEMSAVKVFAYPVIPLFYLLTTLLLMVIAYINRPIESSIAVITILIGIPCYYAWIKYFQRSNHSIEEKRSQSS